MNDSFIHEYPATHTSTLALGMYHTAGKFNWDTFFCWFGEVWNRLPSLMQQSCQHIPHSHKLGYQHCWPDRGLKWWWRQQRLLLFLSHLTPPPPPPQNACTFVTLLFFDFSALKSLELRWTWEWTSCLHIQQYPYGLSGDIVCIVWGGGRVEEHGEHVLIATCGSDIE